MEVNFKKYLWWKGGILVKAKCVSAMENIYGNNKSRHIQSVRHMKTSALKKETVAFLKLIRETNAMRV